MAAGRQYSKDQLNSIMAGHAQQLATMLAQASDFKALIDAMTDADLTGYGYADTEIADIRAVYADLGVLLGIITGQIPVTVGGTTAPINFQAAFRKVGGYAF